MSRTIRKRDPVDIIHAKENINHVVYGKYHTEDELEEVTNDRKNPWKPGKPFKYYRKKIRKAKEKQALREGREIPIFKNDDVWDYN